MAGIKISDLPAAPSSLLTDVFPADQGAVTYKETLQQVLTLFQSNGAALTKTDDTNVTMALGGSPNTALLNAASMTLGWTGNLAVGRGGTGNTTFTAYSVICAGTTATGSFQNVVGLGNAGEQLTSNGPGALPTWQASGGVTPAALTKVDDTNVTLTLGGTPATALLQSTSITAGWTGTLSGTRGGTGVNNGSFTATYGGNLSFASSFTTSGAFAVTQTYTGVTNVTFPTSGTLATTSQLPSAAALTKADDTNVTLTLGGTPSTALLQATSITAGWTGQLGLTRGGTAASLTASNGGIVYSDASAMAILSGTATANKMLLSGATAAPTWSTSTIPTSAGATANKVLLSDGTNYVLSTVTFPNASASAGKFIRSDGTNWIASTPTLPTSAGTSGKILQSDGTNYVESTPTYPSASGSAGKILRADGTNNVYSTSTFADTYTASNLLYSNGANTVTGLATANNKFLTTDGSGVPSMSNPYVTGSWTPVLKFGGATTGITYSGQQGQYTQIGNIVYVRCFIALSSKGSATGSATITGLPVAPVDNNCFANVTYSQSLTFTGIPIVDFITTSVCNLYSMATASGVLTLDNTNFANATAYAFSGFYFTT